MTVSLSKVSLYIHCDYLFRFSLSLQEGKVLKGQACSLSHPQYLALSHAPREC